MEQQDREPSWWQTGVKPDHQASVGWSMMRTVMVWLAVLVALIVVGVVIVAVT